jgi:Domain of unknown function (DUF6379)
MTITLPVERIIGEEGLTLTDVGAKLAMRLPWYRSLPFSVVEVEEVTLNGVAVDLSDARIDYDGQSWPLAENGEQTNAFWFVRDSAFLVIPNLPVAKGETVEVQLTLYISPPYIPGMRRFNVQSEPLTVQSAAGE